MRAFSADRPKAPSPSTKPRATSAPDRPVTSRMRSTKTGPARLTMALVSTVEMISRFRRWRSGSCGKALDRGRREIAGQHGCEGRIVGQGAGQDFGIQIELGIGQQHRTVRAASGPCRHWPASAAAASLGRNSTARSSLPRASRSRMKPAMGVEIARRRALAPPTAPGSGRNCRPAHAPRHRRSWRRAGRCARPSLSSPRSTGPPSRIFRFTSWSEVSTPARIVHRVGVDAPAAPAHIRCGPVG